MTSDQTPNPRHLQATFLGEQDGVPERDLKIRLIAILEANPSVTRAYLARVAYTKTGETAVALCVAGGLEAPDDLVRGVSDVFSELFGIDQHLDVVLLTEDDEKKLAKVCQPFFLQRRSN